MDTQTYNYKVVRQFAIMTVVWGIVGMLVGVIVAAQLFAPSLDLSEIGPWFHFGRLRPLHTNAVIFAFGGCGLIGTSYYLFNVHVIPVCLAVGCLHLPSGVGRLSSWLRLLACLWVIPKLKNMLNWNGLSTS